MKIRKKIEGVRKIDRRMQERDKFGMRSFVKDSLDRGYTLEEIEKSLVSNDYSEKKARAIIEDYQSNISDKSFKLPNFNVSNNVLAVFLIGFMLLNVFGNYYLMNGFKITGFVSYDNKAGGVARMCINTAPEIDISDCFSEVNVSDEYYCIVNASDANGNYSLMIFTFYDNTTIFNISKLSQSSNFSSAEINFTPNYADHIGLGLQKNYSIKITVSDNSGCNNENTSQALSLLIQKGCNIKSPPFFTGVSNNYTISRNVEWLKFINVTDLDPEDSTTLSVEEINWTSVSSFDNIGLNASDVMNISPSILHIGSHILNISAQDNSICTDNINWTLVNVTVDPNNSPPEYIGGPTSLNYKWKEDRTAYPYYLDAYFNDSDGDCLKYEVSYLSSNSFVTVTIDNNWDPRVACSNAHLVSLVPDANQFGQEIICFRANDTIDVSNEICANFTVENVPEPIVLPPNAQTNPPSAGGGGGGGAAGKLKRCEEKWQCSRWDECDEGFRSRNCTDINRCDTSKFKPNVTQSCVFIGHCEDGIQNYDESGVDCGGSCQPCVTCYDGLKNCHILDNGTELCEEGIDCGGPCRLCTEEDEINIDKESGEMLSPAEEKARNSLILWGIILALLISAIVWFILKREKDKKHSHKFNLRDIWKYLLELFRKLTQKKEKKEKIRLVAAKSRNKKKSHKRKKEEHKSRFDFRKIVSRFIQKKKDKKEPEEEEIYDDSEIRLKQLSLRVGKTRNDVIVKELGLIMRDWVRAYYGIEEELTYEDMKNRLKGSLKKELSPFFNKLTELEYSGESVTDQQVTKMINYGLKISAKKKRVIENKKAEKTVSKEKHKLDGHKKNKKKKSTKIAAAVILVIALLGSMMFMFNPDLTGRFVYDTESNFVSIGENISSNTQINLSMGENINSIRISGSVERGTDALVYIGSAKNRYLVLNSSELISERLRVKTDQVIDFTSGKQIDVKVDYKSGTPWDSDDDGLESIEGAIDISVENTLFSWNKDDSKLCTLWKVSNDDGNEYACYGGYECCSLLELVPERDRWDDTFYLNYGKYSATEENLVSVKIIYANYSLDSENAYSDILESETENISASFEKDNIEFNDYCEDSCSIPSLAEYNLFVEVEGGMINIQNLTYTTALATANNAPEFRAMPNITIWKGQNYSIDLNDYVTDPDGDEIAFSYYEADGISISIDEGVANIIPDEGFEGKAYTFFIANDSKQISISNMIEISVLKNDGTEIQGNARVGRPVKWTKRVAIDSNTTHSLDIEHEPINLTVSKIVGGRKEKIDDSKIELREKGQSNVQGISSLMQTAEGKEKKENKEKDKSKKKEIIVEEQAEELELEYYTEGPISTEQNITDFKKQVVISSDIHYTEITASTNIDERPEGSIRLYHLENGSRTETKFDAYDNNGNGLIDYIEWVVPHLSNQTYEVEITVLNVQSYPIVGGEWEVRFTTVGIENLTISAINETSYGNELPDDLVPGELRCGDEVLGYSWNNGNTVRYNNYECNDTGYWTVSVLTSGVHNQMFEFGGSTAYANNYASVNKSGTNLSVWYDWSDDNSNSKIEATETATFYANYTNGNGIADGNCTIRFNYTGVSGWMNESNMTYNGVDSPWTFSMKVKYKNLTYYNVYCENESLASLNVTDNLTVSNSKAYFYDFNTLQVYEDTPYIFNFSNNATDYELNDQITAYGYDYVGSLITFIEHSDCNNCWSFNSNNGFVTISVTTTDHAIDIGTFSASITLYDTDEIGIPETAIINLHAVNDYPYFNPSLSNPLTSAVTEQYYEYGINGMDEEDGTTIIYNMSIFSCVKAYPGATNCLNVNLTIDSVTGTISGTPQDTGYAGNYTLNISLEDSAGAVTWNLTNLTILDNNSAPVLDFVCNGTLQAVEDVIFNCTINATDPEFDYLYFETNLSWFNLNRSKDNEVIANFTPLNEHVGNYSINITVYDGIKGAVGTLSDSVVINFTVDNTNDIPWIFNITNQIAVVGLEYVYYILGWDDDFMQPYNTFTSLSENLTFGLNVSWIEVNDYNDTAARINFTASSGMEGNYSLFASVNDTLFANNNITFNLTIRNNTAPVFDWICNDTIIEGIRTIQEEVLFECYINATDYEGDNFTFAVNTSWFALNSSTGNISFTANDTEVGNHTMNFTVTDSWGWKNFKLINFTVNNTPEAPVIYGVRNMTAIEDLLFTYDLSKNVTDQDMNTSEGDTLYYYVNYSLPSGLLSINETTGLINFTPNNDDALGSPYWLNFTVNDSYGLKTWVIINFSVQATNDPPLLYYVCNDSRNAVEDVLFNCTINATDLDGDALAFFANVSWFNITNISFNQALANFTPLNAQVGNHSINITTTDGNEYDSIIINFTVNNTNDVPYFNPNITNPLSALEDNEFVYDVNASDDDLLTPYSDVLTYASNASSELFIIDSSTGRFNFTPNSSQIGNYSIKFNVTDLAGNYSEQIVNLTILEFNDLPVLGTIPNFDDIQEGTYFYYDVNATDEEDYNDSLGTMTFSWNHTESWFNLNATYGIINFTANITMVGTHTLNLTVTDSGGKKDWQVFNMTITEFNSAPNITQIMPYGQPLSSVTIFSFANKSDFLNNITSITLLENSSILFNHTSEDTDILNSSWYRDGIINYTSQNNSYTYQLDFYEAGQHNITLLVSDGRGGNDTFTWNVTVNNTNRLPVFGKIEHDTYSEFSGGTKNNTNVTSNGIILKKNAGDYYSIGEFISAAIDLGPLFTSFYSPIGFTNISWNANLPVGTNVTTQTRTSYNGVTWGNWSNVELGRSYENSSGEQIISTNATYIQYKLILETSDTSVTPNVTNIRIQYILPDMTLNQGDQNPNWIDLDDYFYDLDVDDTLAFDVTGQSNVNLSISSPSNIVSIIAPDNWYGTEYVTFTANDSYGITESNNLSITVEPTNAESAVEYVYITRTKIQFKTRTRTVTEPRYLEVLSPEHITAFDEDTVVAPIILKNNGESILNGLTLSASSNSDLVDIWFDKSNFDSLAPGQTEESNLFIKWQGTLDEFDVVVNATSFDPEYHDSAIISVTGVSRVQNNRSIEESYIEFVRDLLNNNPECLELTELLQNAQDDFDKGNFKESRNTLNFVIEGCRYLVTTKKDIEQPTPILQRDGDLFKLIAGVLLLLLFIALIIIIALANRERRL